MTAKAMIFPGGHGEYLPHGAVIEPLVPRPFGTLRPEDYEKLPVPAWRVLYEPEWNEDSTPDEHADAVRWFAADAGVDPDEVEVYLSQVGEDVAWSFPVLVHECDRRAVFEAQVAEVDAEVGGDDDTYDYWPSGVRLALALAETDADRARVADVVRRVCAVKGIAADEVGLEGVA